ncbi:MAG: SDR family oxidoreductase [Gemmatimonadetes bacterium]|nr:SDR family oxidoreductase [Gemmatimonadota bacterium]
MSLKGKVAVITGGGSGIGRATALRLAADGARVAVLGRTADELDKVVSEVEGKGGGAMAGTADIAKPEEIRDAINGIVGKWGRIDILFANAGVNGVWATIEDLEPDEWQQTISINLNGTFFTLKYAVPHLKKRGGSIIINSSVNGTRVFSNTGATAYASTKAAQVAMAKMLALELAGDRVRVNVICPGAIETSIGDNSEQREIEQAGVPVEFPEGWHPLRGEPGSSEDVAQLVHFLSSDAARHITGTEIWIDGGESLIGIKG